MKKIAFTLAEVLITLGIIGIVAAMTLPVLIAKYQDNVWKNEKKKVISELRTIMQSIDFDNKFLEYNGTVETGRANFLTLQSYFKITKTCSRSLEEKCWVDSCSTDSDCWMAGEGENNAEGLGFIDVSGRSWVHYKDRAVLWLLIDVNGNKKPNKVGKDRIGIRLCSNRNFGGEDCKYEEGVPRYIWEENEVIDIFIK